MRHLFPTPDGQTSGHAKDCTNMSIEQGVCGNDMVTAILAYSPKAYSPHTNWPAPYDKCGLLSNPVFIPLYLDFERFIAALP